MEQPAEPGPGARAPAHPLPADGEGAAQPAARRGEGVRHQGDDWQMAGR